MGDIEEVLRRSWKSNCCDRIIRLLWLWRAQQIAKRHKTSRNQAHGGAPSLHSSLVPFQNCTTFEIFVLCNRRNQPCFFLFSALIDYHLSINTVITEIQIRILNPLRWSRLSPCIHLFNMEHNSIIRSCISIPVIIPIYLMVNDDDSDY